MNIKLDDYIRLNEHMAEVLKQLYIYLGEAQGAINHCPDGSFDKVVYENQKEICEKLINILDSGYNSTRIHKQENSNCEVLEPDVFTPEVMTWSGRKKIK